MNAVIDTNVLLFDTFEDSESHEEATSRLDSLDKWYLPSIVFHELIWFFRARSIQPSKARGRVLVYLSNEKSEYSLCMADDIKFAATQMKKFQEYNDLIILSNAKRLGQPLFTFDRELKERARRYGVKLIQ